MFGSDANDLFFNSARKTTSYRARQFKMSHEICSIDGICSENACKLFTSKPQYFLKIYIYIKITLQKKCSKKKITSYYLHITFL